MFLILFLDIVFQTADILETEETHYGLEDPLCIRTENSKGDKNVDWFLFLVKGPLQQVPLELKWECWQVVSLEHILQIEINFDENVNIWIILLLDVLNSILPFQGQVAV